MNLCAFITVPNNFYNCFMSMGLKRLHPEQRLGWEMKKFRVIRIGFYIFFWGGGAFRLTAHILSPLILALKIYRTVGLGGGGGGVPRYFSTIFFSRPVLSMIRSLRNI